MMRKRRMEDDMTAWFESFIRISSPSEELAFKDSIEDVGFSAVNQWIHSLHNTLKKMDEKEFVQVKQWLELGKGLLPNLKSFSPSWEETWNDLFHIYHLKVDFYSKISMEERNGEWQVLYDNHFSTDGIVCHSNNSFAEATYLAAKYQLHLKKAEYVKLQKVVTSIVSKGN